MSNMEKIYIGLNIISVKYEETEINTGLIFYLFKVIKIEIIIIQWLGLTIFDK